MITIPPFHALLIRIFLQPDPRLNPWQRTNTLLRCSLVLGCVVGLPVAFGFPAYRSSFCSGIFSAANLYPNFIAHRPPPFRLPAGLQRQLLADVNSARQRSKQQVILAQLRRHIVRSHVVRPALGQAILFEHTFTNPMAHDQVFELAISHPHELVPILKVRACCWPSCLADTQLQVGPTCSDCLLVPPRHLLRGIMETFYAAVILLSVMLVGTECMV